MRARLAMFEEDESSALSQKTNIIGLLLELFLKILCDARSHVGQLTLYGLFGISHKPHRSFFHFPPHYILLSIPFIHCSLTLSEFIKYLMDFKPPPD